MKNKHRNIRTLYVRDRPAIGSEIEAYIIAEIGTNHNRSLETAKAMLHMVAEAGCDCAKFQIYEPDEIVSRRVRASDYGLDSLYGEISARDMFEQYLKTPKEWFPELSDLCHKLGMDFAATIHGEHGLNWAREIDLDLVKIASMDHTNLPFLRGLVNKLDVPILVSLGMARLDDIDAVVATLKDHEPGVGLFHCCAVYPPAPHELHLSNIPFLRQRFSLPVGFSDHTVGIDEATHARNLGAMMFEKHVTTDRAQAGPDHPFAIEMHELKQYVMTLKQTPYKEDVSSVKFLDPSASELLNRGNYVKSVISRRPLPSGHLLTADDVYLARPGSGISAAELSHVIGRILVRPVEDEMPLQWDDIEPAD